ncbi:MAG TPA: hypothetical protein DCR55_13305 [Lentisphaeria bacterium]|nr:hypothetical protein [Lentisphaeria bacterium]
MTKPDVAVPAKNPFEAVPCHNPMAEVLLDQNNCCQIRMPVQRGSGFGAKLIRKFRLYRNIRVNLDAHGSFFWSQVDGKRDLRSIEQKLRTEFSLTVDQSRHATLQFTKMLMLRHLIQLQVEQPVAKTDGK